MPTEITPLKKVLAETRPGSVSATILLVEDDSSVRELVTRLLAMQGYKVLVAESGRAALPIWEEHKRDIDVLLTDVVMPQGIGGRELANRCQADKSHLQIIYTSGYNVELSTQSGWLRDGIQFVQKPYRPEQLLQAVRTAVSQTQNH